MTGTLQDLQIYRLYRSETPEFEFGALNSSAMTLATCTPPPYLVSISRSMVAMIS